MHQNFLVGQPVKCCLFYFQSLAQGQLVHCRSFILEPYRNISTVLNSISNSHQNKYEPLECSSNSNALEVTTTTIVANNTTNFIFAKLSFFNQFSSFAIFQLSSVFFHIGTNFFQTYFFGSKRATDWFKITKPREYKVSSLDW